MKSIQIEAAGIDNSNVGPSASPPGLYSKIQCNADQIRMLRIEPYSTNYDTITCTMSIESLSDPSPFLALSYQWGDSTKHFEILVNDTRVSVGPNLYYALIELRRYYPCKPVWIDAICLNQQDKNEMDGQLLRFKDIYRSAECVITYLGPDAHGSDAVMDELSKGADHGSPYSQTWDFNASTFKRLERPLRSFARRECWYRAWVAREFIFSRTIKIICGNKIVDGESFAKMVEYLEMTDATRNDGDFQHLIHLKRQKDLHHSNAPVGHQSVSLDCARTRATKELDRIYALYDLAHDANDYIAEPPFDYSKTPEQLCKAIFKTFVRQKRSLDIIFLGHKFRSPVLPTWVPDFLDPGQRSCDEQLARYVSGQDKRYRLGFLDNAWTALAKQLIDPNRVRFLDDHFLQTEGCKVGRVQSLSSGRNGVAMTRFKSPVSKCSLDHLRHRISAALSMYAPSGPSSSAAAFALFYLFHFESCTELFYDLTKSQRNKFEILKKWRKANSHFLIDGYTLEQYAANVDRTAFQHMVAQQNTFQLFFATTSTRNGETSFSSVPDIPIIDLKLMLLAMADLLEEDMQLMVTDNFRVGWAHPDAQEGDEIYLLHGCSMPALLRPSKEWEGVFEVIGHCYVDRLMDGKYWQKITASSNRLTEITLC